MKKHVKLSRHFGSLDGTRFMLACDQRAKTPEGNLKKLKEFASKAMSTKVFCNDARVVRHSVAKIFASANVADFFLQLRSSCSMLHIAIWRGTPLY